ncbi:MAG: 50S ribosomal protein L18 [Candidatus Omnitrophica bacterium]|nr:50S ribosomal protein L18 [Candidatus Omnitrophota bacterium]MBU1924845.1 50S ribosomal protein L18 [Candidatus Omnitrophota bacterium]
MKIARLKRHKRIRRKVFGTKIKPRLCVYKSLKNIYAQLVDDEQNNTLLTCTTLAKEVKDKSKGVNIKTAILLGEIIAKKAKEKGIEAVVFDRSGYLYHGLIKALAESARKNGLKF